MSKKGCINKLLYNKRLELKLNLSQASRLLKLAPLTIKLIEKGYISVSKRRQQKFIKGYLLEPNFFNNNFNYVASIDPVPKDTKKFRLRLAKKWVRWASISGLVVSTGLTGFGAYALRRKEISPTIKWTNEFRQFHSAMKEHGEQKISVLHPGELKYVDSLTTTLGNDQLVTSISTYTSEASAADTNFNSKHTVGTGDPTFSKNTIISFDTLIYNKKKVVYSTFTIPDNTFAIYNATGVLQSNGDINLRPFSYYENGQQKTAETGSTIYNQFHDVFNTYYKESNSNLNKLLEQHSYLVYDDINTLMDDIQVISRDNVLYLRLGIWFSTIFASLTVTFVFILSLHFYVYYRHKKKEIKNNDAQLLEQLALNANPKFNRDWRIKLFIPEFVVKLLGFAIAGLSSIAIILIVYTLFYGNIWSFLTSLDIKSFTSNFLIAGVTILFFISLDTYAQKSSEKLLITVFKFLILGFVFYFFEVNLYYGYSTRGNIYSRLFGYIGNLLPGNFFWPLGLYALLFYLLFTTPRSIADNPRKIRGFRSWAALPTAALLVGFLWQYIVKPNANVPYYINFIFYSKGPVLIVFFLLYIYGLFIYRSHTIKKYGLVFNQALYFRSKQYYFIKNAIAACIMLGIVIFDVCGKTIAPNNAYGIGNNWAIGLAIPFVLFYHPHLGKRNKAWDMTCTFILNPLSSAGGYIGAIIEVMAILGMQDLFYILR